MSGEDLTTQAGPRGAAGSGARQPARHHARRAQRASLRQRHGRRCPQPSSRHSCRRTPTFTNTAHGASTAAHPRRAASRSRRSMVPGFASAAMPDWNTMPALQGDRLNPQELAHGHATTRHHHERRHRAHGHEPAPDPLDHGDPRAGRRGAGQRRPRDARSDPDRAQRREDRSARARRTASRAGPPTSRKALAQSTTTPCSSTPPPTQMRADAADAGHRSRQARLLRKAGGDQRSRTRSICAGGARSRGIKHGVVQDKLFLPGLLQAEDADRLRLLRPHPVGARRVRLLGVRGRPGSRRSARRGTTAGEDGGGIILDMLCHWRYVLDNLFGDVKSVSLPRRHAHPRALWTSSGKTYKATADDAAYATFELAAQRRHVIAQINSSWTTRVRRDDLVTFHVDGTHGSAVAGLHECRTQRRVNHASGPVCGTADVRQPLNPSPSTGGSRCLEVRRCSTTPGSLSKRSQWEASLIRHSCVVDDAPFKKRGTCSRAPRAAQLVECALRSWKARAPPESRCRRWRQTMMPLCAVWPSPSCAPFGGSVCAQGRGGGRRRAPEPVAAPRRCGPRPPGLLRRPSLWAGRGGTLASTRMAGTALRSAPMRRSS